MIKYLVAYAASATVFLALDFVWLGLIAKSFYRDQIGHLLAETFDLGAVGLFYGFYVVGIVTLCIAPALDNGTWKTALLSGALLGAVAYGTYDMTNLATLRGWPLTMTFVDIAWGTSLTAMSAIAGFLAVRGLS